MGADADTVVEWVVDTVGAELAAEELWDRGATAVELREEGATTTLIASYPSDGAARVVAAELGAGTVEVPRAWVDGWRPYAGPVEVGTLVVAPAWRDIEVAAADADVTDGTTVISIDPGACFGSGSHPSSRLILAALSERPPASLRVADVGTGSGILAVAAAVLGAAEVVAVDIDPAAAAVVAANAERNGVADRVRPSTASTVVGPFDLVLVNVTAAVQLELAVGVREAVVTGGRVLLAGMLPGQWRHVAPAYAGFEVLSTPELDGWVGAVLVAP